MTPPARPRIAAETIVGHRFQEQPSGKLAHVCPPETRARPRTLEQVEALLKQAPSTRDRLLTASIALADAVHRPDGPGQYVRVPKKEFSDFYWAVRDCEAKR